MSEAPDRPLAEVLVVFAVVAGLTALVMWLPNAVPGLRDYGQLIVGALFLLGAVRLARRQPGGMRRYGIDLSGLLTPPDADDERPPGPLGIYDLARALRDAAPDALREGAVALALAAVVFPPFVVGFVFWHEPAQPFALTLPDDYWEFALTQLLVVALPEEAFFRGYVQTRLHDRWPPKKILGIEFDPRVLVLQAALFAIIHFASIPHPARLAVFFPGLLFGVLRAWRGGIGAAMLFHALCNVLADVLERGYGLSS